MTLMKKILDQQIQHMVQGKFTFESERRAGFGTLFIIVDCYLQQIKVENELVY